MISHWTGLSLLQRTTDFFCKFCQYSFFYFIFAMHWRTCVLYQVEAYLHGNTKKAWLCFLGICKTTIWWKVQKLLYYTPVFLFFFSHTFSYLITFFSNTLDITCLQVGSTGDGVLYVFARLLSSLSLKWVSMSFLGRNWESSSKYCSRDESQLRVIT